MKREADASSHRRWVKVDPRQFSDKVGRVLLERVSNGCEPLHDAIQLGHENSSSRRIGRLARSASTTVSTALENEAVATVENEATPDRLGG